MRVSGMAEARPSRVAGFGGWLPLAAVLAVYVARVSPWMFSDLWFDEVVTLNDFAIGGGEAGSVLSVFRHYPVANNHVLYSAVLWSWVRLVRFSSSEWVLRLPSLVFGALGLVAIVRHWRHWLGDRQAVAAGLLFAVSPVYTSFCYQLRGYSLSMLLAVSGLSGVMELLGGSRRRGLVLCSVSCLLLPVVIPTNVLVVAAYCLVLAAGARCAEARRSTRLRDLCWVGGAGLLGCSYYLTIWPQVVRVSRQTQGWESGWRVAGSLALAFLAHAGPLIPAYLWRTPRATSGARPVPAPRRTASVCAIAVLLVLAPVLAASSPVPFPRTFLVLLPLATFALLLGVCDSGFWRPSMGLLYAGFAIGHGFCWESACHAATTRRVAAGEHPQGLLLQYYRASTGLSEITQAVKLKRLRVGVIVDAYDTPAFRHYWLRAFGESGGPVLPEQALGDMPESGGTWRDRCAMQGCRPGAIAPTVSGARRLLMLAGLDAEPVPIVTTSDRTLFAAPAGSDEQGQARGRTSEGGGAPR